MPVPLQVPSTTGVPGAVPPPWVSRHMPLIWMVPSGWTSQFCSASFWQVVSWTVVPGAELSPASSTHMAATPEVLSSVPPSLPWLKIPDMIEPPGTCGAVVVSGKIAFWPW